jgi:hypothetical protein
MLRMYIAAPEGIGITDSALLFRYKGKKVGEAGYKM